MLRYSARRNQEHHCQMRKENMEEVLVNMIDFQEVCKVPLKMMEELSKNDDFWTNKKKIKEMALIKTAMWEAWSLKELMEAMRTGPDGNIDERVVVPILERAKEDTNRVMQMEISGPDGGPLEMVRRLSQQDLDRLKPFTAMIKAEQKGRLIGQKMIEDGVE